MNVESQPLGVGQVRVKTLFSTISNGAEKANITGYPLVSISSKAGVKAVFPRCVGYSTSGIITEKGENVKSLNVGDKVAMYWTTHRNYNVIKKEYAIKIRGNVSFEEAANGWANTAIEVAGQGAGLDETLDCIAKLGRVALLGCTRNSDFTIDYYRKVHGPGITLIGTHTLARPETKAQILSELVKNVFPKIEEGKIKPTIYKTLPITEAKAAHEILYKGQNVGKVVLTVRENNNI